MKDEGASFLLAIGFLTRLPTGSANLFSPKRMAAAVRYYPLAGVLVGGLSAAVFIVSDRVFPSTISVLLAIASGLLLTGALHEDGLADTFDGLGGGATREKALEIMKDSRLGVYGVLALIIALSLKAMALIMLAPAMIPAALVAGHGFSRLACVMVIATSRYIRAEGTGKLVAGSVSPTSLIIALATGGVIVAVWCLVQTPTALAWAASGLVVSHVLMRLFFEPKLGGYTGDTLGAVQQASETGFYLGLVAWL